MNAILQWQKDDIGYLLVRFEDLIGTKGGGSEQMQSEQIIRIGKFLGFSADEFDVDAIAQDAFSSSAKTFRSGQTNSWRKEFKTEHIQAIKQGKLGKQLIDLGYEKDASW